MRFKVSVDGKKVGRRIRSHIEDGMDDASDDIARGIERTAKAKIRRKGAVWSHELIEGFADTTLEFGDRQTVTVRNVSEHAPAQEYGVSGTERKRDTPLSYGGKMPPVQSLIPWVRAHLTGTGFDPGWTPHKKEWEGGDSGDDGGDGGSTVTRPPSQGDYDPLMGADRLEKGTSVLVSYPDRGSLTGTISRVHTSGSYDYTLDIDADDSFIDFKAEWIENFDGKGASPLDVEQGKTVYVGGTGSFGKISEVTTGDDGVINGAKVDYRDGDLDSLYDLSEFEVVPDDYNPIITDSDGRYLPGLNFREYDPDETWDIRTTFPGQDVVIYDEFDDRFRRAEVIQFPKKLDEQIRVRFEDDGGVTDVGVDNTSGFRLVGGRFWESLTTPEKKEKLRDHFDNVIRDGYKTALLKPLRDRVESDDPTDASNDYIRDTWIDELWDTYDDDFLIKETFRSFIGTFRVPKKRQNNILGSVAPRFDNKFAALFWSQQDISDHKAVDADEYKKTVFHESLHALTQSFYFGRNGNGDDWKKTLDEADWKRDGGQRTIRAYLPNHARQQMFTDKSVFGPDVVGGEDWMEDAYDAAVVSDIRNYSPTFQSTKGASGMERLLEASNHAWWLQSVRAREAKKAGTYDKKADFFVFWAYSSANAEETLATTHEVLSSSGWEDRNIKFLVGNLHEYYPWLVEEWLDVFNPGSKQRQLLDFLGYDV